MLTVSEIEYMEVSCKYDMKIVENCMFKVSRNPFANAYKQLSLKVMRLSQSNYTIIFTFF